MIFRHHAVMLMATGGYAGKIPWAPGTFGTLVGLPIVYALAKMQWPVALALTVLIVLVAVYVAHAAERLLQAVDPGCIVIDEIAGICVAMCGIPMSFASGLAGFLVFRFFDVLKPPPIRLLEQKLSGGWGVVMDDVAAGALTQLVLRFGLLVWGKWFA
jgi:phosphatidylglycerophosphatase A